MRMSSYILIVDVGPSDGQVGRRGDIKAVRVCEGKEVRIGFEMIPVRRHYCGHPDATVRFLSMGFDE